MNLIDVHPGGRLHFSEAVSLEAGWAFFWRYSKDDGIYSNALSVIQAANGSGSRYVGNELSLILDWKISRHVNVRAGYARFFAGSFLKDTGPGEDQDYYSVFLKYQF